MGIVVQWALSFPLPPPIEKLFLPPQQRWPTAQIERWVESGSFDQAYLDYFARDPDRSIPAGNNLVSPSDGVVKFIAFRNGVTYVVIGLSFWDVHVVRSPEAGRVMSVEPEGVTFYGRENTKDPSRYFLQGKPAPVQQIVTLQTQRGPIKVRLITSYWASRIKVWIHEGQLLQKGDRIGRILLGSTVIAEIPGRVELAITTGQRVTGGETVIYAVRAR